MSIVLLLALIAINPTPSKTSMTEERGWEMNNNNTAQRH